MKHLKYIFLFLITFSLISCGYYSFTGAKPREDLKTFQVNYFQNNAPIIEPGLVIREFNSKSNSFRFSNL